MAPAGCSPPPLPCGYDPHASRRRIAHHGNSYTSLENTLDASASAMKIGCDWLEPDVQTTRDDRLVALHDETILTRRVRYRHLTTRDQNKLKPTQAQTVIAAALLRQLWAVVTTGRAWDGAIAANGHHPTQEVTAVA